MSVSEGLRTFFQTYLNFRSTLFWLHQRRELRRHKEFFDTIERQPLTDQQRRSVVLDERRSLIVAGAGTGKTSVIVAKVGYLIKSGRCKPEEILLLAFNADAAKELSARCGERLGVEIRASTFHALGNQIVRTVEPRAPTLSRLAQDKQFFSEFLSSIIEELKGKDSAWRTIRRFFLGHLKPYKSEFEFVTQDEYVSYTRSVELRALSGHLVKSFAELDIANFLYFNGVNFEYEKRYPYASTPYQPDFYLIDYGIWIEHFGVDENGKTAPYIDQEVYQRGMEWKRSIHKSNKTRLLETYSWQRSRGILTTHLNKLLKAHGVRYAPRSQDEIFRALQRAGYTTQLASLVEIFLSHFKSSQMSLELLKKRAKNSVSNRRAEVFVELFHRFFSRYQSELEKKEPREIDFNDMITSATHYVRERRFTVPWKRIIVDEFQDISVGRYLLLRAMLESRRDLKFFAVGDDWQSIYRFAGSELSIMSRFREFFGRATIVKLDQTFRFKDKIAQVSSHFVLKNPNQIRKVLGTSAKSASPQVYLHWEETKTDDHGSKAAAMEKIVRTISEDVSGGCPSLLILARYNRHLPEPAVLRSIARLWPGEVRPPLTIHKAKGLEADYVIVDGFTAERYGFPSEVEDDPLLNLVLATPESFPHAEERRLFYVALTRARHQVHMLVDRTKPSVFALELRNPEYDVRHVDPAANADAKMERVEFAS